MTATPLSPRAAFAAHKVFLGSITPSGNTVVERITLGILQHFPQVSMHFSRTPVFGDTDPFPGSYDFDSMLAAARLLSHANPQRILWNGSKAAGISLDLDRHLCARIVDQTGIPATTSILALEELLKADGITRFALVSPYTAPYQQRIVECLAREGYTCVAQEYAGLADNLSFASIAPDSIAEMLRRAAAAKPQVILSICTNFPAAVVVGEMEQELNIPIWDTTILPVWQALKLAGIDTRPGRAWGRLFER
jgi:maleate isomerase